MSWLDNTDNERNTSRRIGALRLQARTPAMRRRWVARAGLLLVAIVLVTLGFRTLSGRMAKPVERTATVIRGVLEIASSGEGVLIRPEHVQVAPMAGDVSELEPAGRVVRVGTAVVNLRGAAGSTPVAAERPGLVSYNVDGLEMPAQSALRELESGNVQPGSDWLQRLTGERQRSTPARVQAGEPLFKLVDPSRLWVAVELPAEGVNLKPGQAVRAEFTALGSDALLGVASRSAPTDGKVVLVLESQGQFPDSLQLLRRTPVKLLFDRAEGFLVPRAAVVTRDGDTGVWVQIPGEADKRWVPVTVQGGDKTRLAVQGKLATGDKLWFTANSP